MFREPAVWLQSWHVCAFIVRSHHSGSMFPIPSVNLTADERLCVAARRAWGRVLRSEAFRVGVTYVSALAHRPGH